PLLQNFGGRLDRLNYELSQYDIDFTEIQVLENQEGFVLDLGLNFLDWTLLSEQKRIANERLNLAQEQLQQTRRKRQANLVDKVDVLRTEDAARIANQNIVLIQSQFKSKQAELAVLAQSQEIYNLNPEFDLYTLETLPTLDDAVSQLKEKSRILRALGVRREQLSHLSKGYTETKRPQLFLSIGTGLQSGDEEFSNSFDLDKPDVLVALDFHYPFGNRTAKSDIAKTDLELIQIEKDIENVSLNLEAGVRNLLISIKEMEKVLVLNQEQIESAKAKTREELRLYNQGRGILTFVIQSRDNEEQAKLTYAQNAANYHKLILQYRALMDELFTK
ncbi:TolC family protein, partial [candidate division WOR-3 bacterium]|nr:TolC family protein [candidate division WOR-3 bacterium]